MAIVRVKGHSSSGDTDARGNNLADEAAGWAAKEGHHSPHISKKPVYGMLSGAYTPSKIDLLLLQSEASDRDVQYWHDNGVDKPADDSLLYDSIGRIALPASTLPFLIRHFHGVSHVGQKGVIYDINKRFCIRSVAKTVKLILNSCLTCARTNCQKPGASHDALPPPSAPFQSLQIDFTHMPQKGPIKYMLVIVDQFSKWVEAFPCAKEKLSHGMEYRQV